VEGGEERWWRGARIGGGWGARIGGGGGRGGVVEGGEERWWRGARSGGGASGALVTMGE
jgi:hypothetical protein